MKTTKCLNEWNATIEALGNGKQTVLIRKYGTSLKGFLLYPTVSYANKDDVLDSFQEEYKSFEKIKNRYVKVWKLFFKFVYSSHFIICLTIFL